MHILSPKQIVALPEFFETVLPDVVPTIPEEEGTTKGSLHLREPWVWANAYSFELLPLYACHFNPEEGLRPLTFIHFVVQDKEPYILGTAGQNK
jgi:hypothetical protein